MHPKTTTDDRPTREQKRHSKSEKNSREVILEPFPPPSSFFTAPVLHYVLTHLQLFSLLFCYGREPLVRSPPPRFYKDIKFAAAKEGGGQEVVMLFGPSHGRRRRRKRCGGASR